MLFMNDSMTGQNIIVDGTIQTQIPSRMDILLTLPLKQLVHRNSS